MNDRPRLVMAVFNPIEFDGRVMRAADALADAFDVTVLCLEGSGQFSTPCYQIVRAPHVEGPFPKVRRHLRFWLAYLTLAWRLRPAVVYAHDFFLSFIGWVVARLFGAQYVYDAHELLVPDPRERVAIRDRIFLTMERLVVARADLVIAANTERADVMRQYYALSRTPTTVGNVPPMPTASMSDAEVVATYPPLVRHAPQDIHIVYHGDVNFGRGLRAFIDALDHLGPRFVMLVIGGGPDQQALAAMHKGATPEGAPRLRAIGRTPHAHLHELVRRCDIGLVMYPFKGLNNILCASNKIVEYAQAGIPVVSTCQPPIARVVGAYGFGELLGCSDRQLPDATAIARAIETVARNHARYVAALPAFLQDARWEMERDRLVTGIRGLLH